MSVRISEKKIEIKGRKMQARRNKKCSSKNNSKNFYK